MERLEKNIVCLAKNQANRKKPPKLLSGAWFGKYVFSK